MRHQKVHGNVLAVYVLVHHVPDGLGHHVRVQVGVVLQGQKKNTQGKSVSNMAVLNSTAYDFFFFKISFYLTLWKKAAPVRTMESSQE